MGNKPEKYENLRKMDQFKVKVSDGPDGRLLVSTKTIESSIYSAFKDGLVRIEAQDIVHRQRVPSIEQQLRDKLSENDRIPHLRGLIVVDDSEAINSNQTHLGLGYALAENLVVESQYFRHGDRIALGSGRGPWSFVEGCQKLLSDKLHLDNITLLSLTGDVYPEGVDKIFVDADFNVGLMCRCFSGGVSNQEMISRPIAFDDKDELIKSKKNTWLGPSFKDNIPTHAFIGVGFLGDGHRFYIEAKSGTPTKILNPIHQPLVKIITLIEELGVDQTLITDICHRFSMHWPPAGTKFSVSDERAKEIKDEIQEHIDTINSKVLTVNLEQLKQIDNIILIAGSKMKAQPILDTLKEDLKITTLCTSASAANEMMAILDSSKN